jgi:AcrR family transcriptional regulator
VTSLDAGNRRSARKAKGDGYLRRAEILEAAERIFVAEGYEGATIRKIADEVGVSSTALYMHFPDKGRILLEICERAIRHILERTQEIAARRLAPSQRIRLILEAYVAWAFEHPNAYLLVYSIPHPVSAAAWTDDMNELGARLFEAFLDVVREAAAAGRLRAGTAESAAQVLWMCGHGLVSLLLARPKFSWEERNDLIQVLLDGVVQGVIAD